MSHSDWKVGDRVQKSEWPDRKEVITTGAVSEVITATREKQSYHYSYGRKGTSEMETYIDKISIKWDNGTEEQGVSPWHVSPEDSEYEREFRIKSREISDLIHEKLAIADKAIDEAVAIAEEHGVSFSAGVSPLGQSYMAASAMEKWPEVSKRFMSEITETHGEYDGWQHSAVCY